MDKRCEDCIYFEFKAPTFEYAGMKEVEHDGICTHERNWRPSRGDMPCDRDYHCQLFELRRG